MKIPRKILNILKNEKMNKTKQISFIKVVESLIFKNRKSNKDKINNFFPVPSKFLKKVNCRYDYHIKLLLKYEIIEYKSINTSFSSFSLFDLDESYRHKYYNTHTNECMQYRFLIDIEEDLIDLNIDIDMTNIYKDEKWYKITEKSLKQINQKVKIVRDSYSRRLHTSITNRVEEVESYKNLFKMYNDKYVMIDIVECQPTLLFNFLKEKNVEIDTNFTPGSIYSSISNDRKKAKKDFLTFLNSDIYISEFVEKFPKISKWMYDYKLKNGEKSISRRLQRIESDIMIDNILSDLSEKIDFCLTVHDSIIIDVKDIEVVNEYLKKYNDLIFKIEKFDI